MQKQHETNVQNQFGPRAEAYVASAVHATGEDLARISERAAATEPKHAIDLGCGGGHVAYALAPYAEKVTATDLSPAMLAAVAQAATARGLANIATVEASVEDLPFEDATFDFLGCRYSAHHWLNVEQGLSEARRVLKPDAPAIFVDVYAPARPLLDTHLQCVELLRDTSHVRDYALAEWLDMLARCGFEIDACRTWRLKMEFATWTDRMATPPHFRDAIRALQQSAADDVKAHFAIEDDGSFMLDMLMIEARAH